MSGTNPTSSTSNPMPPGTGSGTQTAPGGVGTSATHWTLAWPPEITKFFPLHGKLGVRLSTDNYVTWAHVAETVLCSLNVFGYCNGDLPCPMDATDMIYWRQTDMLVQGVLM